MARYALEPGAKLGVKMQDGTVYRPSRSGVIEVTDTRHVAQLRAHNSAKNLDLIIEQKSINAPHMSRNDCPNCLFASWPWDTSCKRCGTVYAEKQET